MRLVSIILFILFARTFIVSQETRVPEVEIKTEESYIEAKKLQLMGKYTESISMFKKLLEDDRRNTAILFELAKTYKSEGDINEALFYLDKVLNSEPDSRWVLEFKGFLLWQEKRYEEAASVYEQLASFYPDYPEYCSKQVANLALAEKFSDAIEVLDNLEARIGITDDIIRRKFDLYNELGKVNKAAAELKKLSDHFPKNTDYLHLLASYYAQTDEKGKATETYQRILELDPEDSRANLFLASSYRSSGDDVAYLNSIERILYDPDVLLEIKVNELLPFIQKLSNENRPDLAIALKGISEKLSGIHKNDAAVWALAGDIYSLSGDEEKAIEKYEKAIILKDNVYLVWEQYLMLLEHQGEYIKLLAESEKALDVFPNRPVIYFLRGKAMAYTGYFENAIEDLELAMMMSSNDPAMKADILGLQGMIFNEMDERVLSDQAFEQGLKIHKDHQGLISSYAYVLASRKEQLDKAMKFAEDALKKDSDNYMLTHILGWIWMQKSDFEKAEIWFSKSLEKGGINHPLVLEHYGDLKFHQNDMVEALRYWKKALEKNPNSDILKSKISSRKIEE